MVICLIDNAEFDSVEHLHLYLRQLKVKQSDYYTKYIKKTDLLTGEPIPFKNPEQYLNSDFINKNNLKKYIKENPEKGREWAIGFLRKRKEEKGLKYAPTQVELRSLQCPSIPYYDSIGGYNKICKELGFKIRFTGADLEYREIMNPILIQDTREQLPLKTKFNTIVKKLDVGDYALEHNVANVFFERKSLADFVGSLTRELGRFSREIERASKKNKYIVILVEESLENALGFNYLPHMRYTKVNPSHVFKNLRDLFLRFDNFQCVFANGRKESLKLLEYLLFCGESVKFIDLQYKLEKGEMV